MSRTEFLLLTFMLDFRTAELSNEACRLCGRRRLRSFSVDMFAESVEENGSNNSSKQLNIDDDDALVCTSDTFRFGTHAFARSKLSKAAMMPLR